MQTQEDGQLYRALLSEVKEDVLQLREEMRSNVSDLKLGMDNLSRSLAESQRAPWATLGVWAGVLVAFGGLVASGLAAVGGIMSRTILREVDEHSANIASLERDRTDDKVKLAALEQRIQEDVRDNTRIRDEQFARVFDRISKIELWMESELGLGQRHTNQSNSK
jgi:hypothetical protein